jgi:threonine/homoserine/homoserine lactone efflux protein
MSIDISFFLMITILPFISGPIIFVISIIPVVGLILNLGSLRGKGSLKGIFWGFVTSFTLFRLLISSFVKMSEISLANLQIIGIIFLIFMALLMVNPPWQRLESGFKRGFAYSALLGFVWSFWVGISKAVFSDDFDPKQITFLVAYITFMSCLLPGFILVLTTFVLSKLPTMQRFLAAVTIVIAVLLLFHVVEVAPREGLKPKEPPPKTLKEIFNLK